MEPRQLIEHWTTIEMNDWNNIAELCQTVARLHIESKEKEECGIVNLLALDVLQSSIEAGVLADVPVQFLDAAPYHIVR